MAAHRGWRLDFPNIGNTYVSITEVWLRDASNVDVSVGGTAVATSSYGPWPPANAFDRDLGSQWANAGGVFPTSLGYMRPAPFDAVEVEIHCALSAGELMGVPTSSYTDDGVSWSGPSAPLTLLSGSIAANTLARFALDDSGAPPATIGMKNMDFDVYATGIVRPALTFKNMDFQKVHKGYWDGTGRVWGYVDKNAAPSPNVPLRRKVVCFRERDNYAVGLTWSRPSDGFYEFLNLNAAERYYTVAFDYEHSYRMVGADNLTPEQMT